MSGPCATSDEDKKAKGNYRPYKHRPQPKYTARTPRMPAYLKKNKIAAKIWRELIPEMAEAKLLIRPDARLLAAFCELCALQETSKKLNLKNVTTMRVLGSQFGLTPASRLRTPPLVEEPEEEAECLEGKRTKNRGNIIQMFSADSSTRKTSETAKSTSADTSEQPVTDKSKSSWPRRNTTTGEDSDST